MGKGNDKQMQRNLLLQGKHQFLVAALHLWHVLRVYLKLLWEALSKI